MLDKIGIAKRIAKEVKNGYYVNLGIGIPTLVANYVCKDIEVDFQSENGVLGMGPFPFEGEEDAGSLNSIYYYFPQDTLIRLCFIGFNSRCAGGRPDMIETIARAGIVNNVDGLFIETHFDPSEAKSDGANMLHLKHLEKLLTNLTAIRLTVNSL